MNLHEFMLAKQLASKNTGGNADLSNYYTKSQTDGLISGKVDKSDGKGLSTNDFTNADKSKLNSLENYDDTEIKADIANTAEQTAINKSTLGYQRKNILPNSAAPLTKNGITYTINHDGSITVNGTATNLTNFVIHTFDDEISGKGLILSGCSGGSSKTYYMDSMKSDFSQQIIAFDGDVQLWGRIKMIRIVIVKGMTMNNVNFYPMIRPAEITDDTYESYRPSIEERLTALENAILGGN
ncbi:MAG: hypothetical protein K2O60_00405 [Ruminococcus sp.]|nr:hypothetical protein [Ruminococcus sp.]